MASRDTNAGDGEQVKKRRTKLELAREKEVANLHKMLGTYEGREFMWRLLSEGSMFHTTFVHEAPHTTSWNEGKRQVALWAYTELFTAKPEAYTMMVSEANQRERELAS